jgi:hypothetical protein
MYVYEQVYDEQLMKIYVYKWGFAWVFIDKISVSLLLILIIYSKIENNGCSVTFLHADSVFLACLFMFNCYMSTR